MGRLVGEAFAKAVKDLMKKEKLSVTAVAKRMGVSRQTVHSYLNGHLPRQKRLNNMMSEHDLGLTVGGRPYDKTAFVRESTKMTSQWKQLTLFEALDSISSEDLEVNVRRTGRVLRVHVAIDIPA